MATAQKRAKDEKKGMLIKFTGYIGCESCEAFERNVLNNEAYWDLVKDRYVFIHRYFASTRGNVDADMEDETDRLAQQYGVMSFPTLIYTDAEGRPFCTLIGHANLAEAVRTAKEANETKPAFDRDMEALEKAPSDEKYRILGRISEHLTNSVFENYYKALVKDARENDINNISGIRTKELEKDDEDAATVIIEELSPMMEREPLKAAAELESRAAELPPPSFLRQILLTQASYLTLNEGDPDGAADKMQRAIDACPNSSEAKQLRGFLKGIIHNRENILADAEKRRQQKAQETQASPPPTMPTPEPSARFF